MATQAFKISDMTCSSCIMHIEALEDKLPGVKRLDVNFKRHQMTAEFDESKITPRQIADAVSELGYPATAMEERVKRGFLPWKR